MKKASVGITAVGAVLLVIFLVISLNIVVFFPSVFADEEICDYLDNDNNGLCYGGSNNGATCESGGDCPLGTCIMVDEDFDYFGISIGNGCNGVGECGWGVVYCVDSSISDCSTNPERPDYDGTTEICNKLDDDCDGETDEDGVCEYNISLNIGWNLFSPTMGPVEFDTDKHIPLRKGWNLIGYASSKPLYWLNATIENGMDSKNVSEAALAGWLQRTCYFYHDRIYKDIPGDDYYLRESRGYWVYALEDDLTLVLPGVGGSLETNSVPWMGVNATNGTDTITVEQATQLGWFQATLYYFDADVQNYRIVPFHELEIHPWKGYWLSGNLAIFSLIFN